MSTAGPGVVGPAGLVVAAAVPAVAAATTSGSGGGGAPVSACSVTPANSLLLNGSERAGCAAAATTRRRALLGCGGGGAGSVSLAATAAASCCSPPTGLGKSEPAAAPTPNAINSTVNNNNNNNINNNRRAGSCCSSLNEEEEEDEEEAVGGGNSSSQQLDLAANLGKQQQQQHQHGPTTEEEEEVHQGGAVTYNMVAAMSEHLYSTSAGNSLRLTAACKEQVIAAAGLIKEDRSQQQQQQICIIGQEEQEEEEEHAELLEQEEEEEEEEEDSAGAKVVSSILGYPCTFDHMYASMTDGGAPAAAAAAAAATSALGVGGPLRGNEALGPTELTEVKHLKELLLLHLDLIQQQSEQIVTKDKLLAALRQENETLKLRLERMDRRVSLQKMRSDNAENSLDHIGSCSPPSINTSLNCLPSTSENQKVIQSNSLSPQYSESFKIRLNTSGGVTTVKQELPDKIECKQETMGESWENKKKRKSDSMSASNSVKRKRGVSSSSTISNDTSSTVPESHGGKGPTHESIKKLDKKGKSLAKKESYLTTDEHYYTAVGNPNFILSIKDRTSPETMSSTLEVPNWRVKVYTSCYTMEGTENLDDEIFNKRHLKLENDERRRKRWDVQRIREQRHIEKLKQRQERQSHHSACYNLNHSGPCLSSTEEEKVTTLWPEIDQIQSIQVDYQLPISAFGSSIPSFTLNDFALPWLINSKLKIRRPKRLNSRRRKSSRR